MAEINQEPSMEEILASIKRVISEDGRGGSQRQGRTRRIDAGPGEEGEGEDEDVLELDSSLEEAGLLSPDTAAASRQSLAALAALSHHEEPRGFAQPVEGPLEAVVRDMLRPLLKQWLEQNLPIIVEEIVSREVSRITGKRL
jgi:cell pole-organizing protein PopZ